MSETTVRREDARLLTGSGRYTADWNLPGQLYAYFLRSDRPHAEIVSIDPAAARARKGVRLVLTGADYAASGWKSLPGGVTYDGVGGQKQKKPFWPALAHGKVHYVGQPVALVVAESAAIAQDASEDIVVEYRDLPAVVGFKAATRAGAPQLHADIPGNLAFEYESGDRAAVDAAFAGAAHISRFTLRSQRLVGNPIEPRAFLAAFEQSSGVFTVYSPSQGAASGSVRGLGVGGLSGIAAGTLIALLARGSDVRFEIGSGVEVSLNQAIGIEAEKVMRAGMVSASSPPAPVITAPVINVAK